MKVAFSLPAGIADPAINTIAMNRDEAVRMCLFLAFRLPPPKLLVSYNMHLRPTLNPCPEVGRPVRVSIELLGFQHAFALGSELGAELPFGKSVALRDAV